MMPGALGFLRLVLAAVTLLGLHDGTLPALSFVPSDSLSDPENDSESTPRTVVCAVR